MCQKKSIESVSPRTRFYNFIPYTDHIPSNHQTPIHKISKFYLFIRSCFVDHVTILFTLMWIEKIVADAWQGIVIADMTGVRSAIAQQQLRLLYLFSYKNVLTRVSSFLHRGLHLSATNDYGLQQTICATANRLPVNTGGRFGRLNKAKFICA